MPQRGYTRRQRSTDIGEATCLGERDSFGREINDVQAFTRGGALQSQLGRQSDRGGPQLDGFEHGWGIESRPACREDDVSSQAWESLVSGTPFHHNGAQTGGQSFTSGHYLTAMGLAHHLEDEVGELQ